jgi:hypothetical protein
MNFLDKKKKLKNTIKILQRYKNKETLIPFKLLQLRPNISMPEIK